MTDPGARLRSSLAADQSPGSSSGGMADFDSPIAMEALRATRVLHAADQEPFPAPGRIRVITVANQKGGVGKTTSTVNLGVALALYGLRTLVIDLDPQGNASTALGVEHTVGTPSVYDALVGDNSLGEVVHPTTASPKLLCVPATIDLAGAEIELVSVVAREHRLRRAIEAYVHELPPEQRPHYVLIDCPPSLGLLTLYDGRTKLADQVADEVRNHFGELVLPAVIPRNVRVSEAPGYGQSVLTYDPGSRGSTSYVEAARQLAERGVDLPPLERTGMVGVTAAPPVAGLSLGNTAAPSISHAGESVSSPRLSGERS